MAHRRLLFGASLLLVLALAACGGGEEGETELEDWDARSIHVRATQR